MKEDEHFDIRLYKCLINSDNNYDAWVLQRSALMRLSIVYVEKGDPPPKWMSTLAAAPEMLETLKVAKSEIVLTSNRRDWRSNRALDQIKKSIAKAEGKENEE